MLVDAPRRQEGLSFKKEIKTPTSLGLEVDRLKVRGINSRSARSPLPSDEQGEWYLLPGTGFNVKSQVNQLRTDLRDGFETGKRKDEILDTWLQKTEEDIKGFKLEYLMQGLVFPIVLDRQVVNGQERIVGPMYGGKPLADTITEQERNGAVKRSVAKIENFLLKAPPGSTAVMTSPDGWSGMKGITYQDSQTYGFKVMEDGRPMGFTIRSDMTIDENKKLLKALGNKEGLSGKNEKETTVKIVDNPVFNIGVSLDFADIARKIQEVKGSNFAYENKRFSEIYETLENPQKLWEIDDTTKMLVDEFREFVRSELSNINSESIVRLEMALGITILKLSRAMRTEKEKPQHRLNISHPSFKLEPFPYTRELEEVQKLIGCNGGGKKSLTVNSISPRSAKFSQSEEDYDFDEKGTCAVCSRENVGVGPCGICEPCDKKLSAEGSALEAA